MSWSQFIKWWRRAFYQLPWVYETLDYGSLQLSENILLNPFCSTICAIWHIYIYHVMNYCSFSTLSRITLIVRDTIDHEKHLYELPGWWNVCPFMQKPNYQFRHYYRLSVSVTVLVLLPQVISLLWEFSFLVSMSFSVSRFIVAAHVIVKAFFCPPPYIAVRDFQHTFRT